MANIVIKGVYTTKAALDSAELATASNGDTYIVGSKIPYDLYTYSSSKTAFEKGSAVSNMAKDLNTQTDIDDLYSLEFIGEDGKTLKVRKGLHLGEIHLYVPAS